ncbi:uncharacterized protein LOC129737874 [Uranotaenia lowii]|uniref:uncharacterized protein LOC129737874 n=1 Tax=Uranotaenia lowii TaxID=190385 RepID=UPI00247A601F|nr:uncharacterized protein LOC129737874 [Uranotaenia lowii]
MSEAMDDETRMKIEECTRDQYNSELWKTMRIGRITASNLKKVASTRIDKPSVAILKLICYPDMTYFSTQATRYGKAKEKNGFKMVEKHAYYFQTQMQIAVTEARYGYFYVWTKNENLLITVPKNDSFWNKNKHKANVFFKAVILPELLSQYYTKRTN